jgi:predicted ribosome quality control (RQC) complex YloA/Tae2 family protein
MALDAGFLKAVAAELCRNIISFKVDKIYEPTKDEIILQLRGYSGGVSLLLSANASNARVHLSNQRRENPATPPMFCMLMRKHLAGAKLISIEQPDFERVLYFRFSGYNELSEPTQKCIAMEIMGRHSNIVLFDEDGRIIDAIRHVDFSVSSQRQVLPGLYYKTVPSQNKHNPLTMTKEEIEAVLGDEKDPRRADKYLLDKFSGLSPLVLREVLFRSGCDMDVAMNQLTSVLREKLTFQFMQLIDQIKAEKFTPVMLMSPGDKKPKDFSFLNIYQYGTIISQKTYDSFSVLLDDFYEKRDAAERIRQKSQDVLKIINNAISRASKKMNIQKSELVEAKNRDRLKTYGDLIMANLHLLSKGMKSCQVENFYEPELPLISINLDDRLTPAQNAQKYYREYAKARTKEKYLTEQIQTAQSDILYLESILESLEKAENEREFSEIRGELKEAGYINAKKSHEKGRKIKKSTPTQPMKFLSDDGYTILIGKNNLQNDRLTMKMASKYDLWLHTKNFPGSHTVVVSQGQEIPPRTITQAAILAATFSKAKASHQVPVDYTAVKNVKKPSGAKPGMVIYDHYETAIVTPDENLVQRLRQEDEKRG